MRWIFISITIVVIIGISLCLNLVTPEADASCGSANCFLITGTQEGIASEGQIIMDISYRFIPMDRIHEGSSDAPEALVPRIDFENGVIVPDGHSEVRTNNELMQVDIGYGITPRFALALSIPFFNLRTHEHFEDTEFTRQDGTSGLGDLRLTGRYTLWVSTKNLLVSGIGVKIPSGEYKLLSHDGEINEPTIMPGTGSWDGLFSAYYAYQIFPHRLDTFFSASYQIATKNDLDYQFGNRLILNGGVNYRPGERTTTSLQVNARLTPHDEFKGEIVPSTGGKWVYLTPGIKVEASENTSLYTFIQIPVYQFVNEANLVPRYGLILGISHAF